MKIPLAVSPEFLFFNKLQLIKIRFFAARKGAL